MTFRNNVIEAVAKGDKAAVLDEDGSWVSAAELENAEGRGRFLAFFARSVTTPGAQAAELASQSKELKKEGDARCSFSVATVFSSYSTQSFTSRSRKYVAENPPKDTSIGSSIATEKPAAPHRHASSRW
jgi:hypothetical protein